LHKVTLHIGDELVLEGSAAGLTDVEQLEELPDGVTLTFKRTSGKDIDITGGGGTITEGTTSTKTTSVSLTFSRADIEKLISVIGSDWKITQEITIGSLHKVTLHIGDELVLEGSAEGLTDVQQLEELSDGVTLTFKRITGKDIDITGGGGSSSTTTTGKTTVVTNGGGGKDLSTNGGNGGGTTISGGGGGITGVRETSTGKINKGWSWNKGDVVTEGEDWRHNKDITIKTAGCACCAKVPGLREWLARLRAAASEEIEGLRVGVGEPGPPGPPGLPCKDGGDVQGPPGAEGKAGAEGEAGPDGLAGAHGVPGSTGVPGMPGKRGAPGKNGADGLPGAPGSPGLPGIPGEAGADGRAGAHGAPGPPGADGKHGADGKRGPKGPPGKELGDAQEITEISAEHLSRISVMENKISMLGEEKEISLEGGWTNEQVQKVIVGAMKDVSEKSTLIRRNRIASYRSQLIKVKKYVCPPPKAGSPGAPGEPGKAGLEGNPGAEGDTGMPGTDGEDGPPGVAGPPGPPGRDGEPGKDGMNGADGKPGEDGNPGQPGVAGADGLPGEVGAPGEPGPAGDVGSPGLPGRDGGNGRDGMPGAPGDDGPAGATGAPGLDGLMGQPGSPGLPGGMGLPGFPGDDGDGGDDGAPGSAGSPGKPGQDGMPGPPGPEGPGGHEGLPGSGGAVGSPGKDGMPGKDGRDGQPGALGAPGKPGADGQSGDNGGVGMGAPGKPGPPGPVGEPGDPPEMEELSVEVDNSKDEIKRIQGIISELAVRNTELEHFIDQEVQIIGDRSADIMKLFTDLQVEITQEVEESAEELCRADFQARSTPCCPNCTKAEFRTPSSEECSALGCEHSCAYVKVATDRDGQKLGGSCTFPFTVGGEEMTECTKKSPYGEVLRPWCYVGHHKEKAVGFCDITEIQCVCPEGSHLKKDGKSCTR